MTTSRLVPVALSVSCRRGSSDHQESNAWSAYSRPYGSRAVPVSFAARGFGNSDSRCIIARIPWAAAGLTATVASRDSICADGSKTCGDALYTVVLPREFTGSPHRAVAIHPGATPGLRHAAGAVPEGSTWVGSWVWR